MFAVHCGGARQSSPSSSSRSSTQRSTHSSQIALVGPAMILWTSRAGLVAERAAGEFAAQFALSVVVVELFGDEAGGFSDLVVRVGSAAEIPVWFVDCGRELIEGSIQPLPGDDGESWAVAS